MKRHLFKPKRAAIERKLADLRQYVDGMAESVFIGQREALESEFAPGTRQK